MRSYKRLARKSVYRNIDWVLYSREGRFEYDLVVHPGANLDEARLRVEGADAHLNPDGTLQAGDILHWRPAAYQFIAGGRTEVAAQLVPRGDGEFGFVVGPHRTDLDLTIDPAIQTIAVAGGSDDDTIVGTANTGTCSYRYGITSSSGWSHLPGQGHSVFVQLAKTGQGTQTLFWGGDGDSQIGGADIDPASCGLSLAGWTSAQNAPVLNSVYGTLATRPYAGGAADGFLLRFGWNGLAFASYFGGPGADRIYEVRRTAAAGYDGTFTLVGETDNTAWPLTSVQQVGPGGQVDAFAAQINGSQLNLLTIGGSGNDRAMRLRAADAGYWAIAGETDSADFPATAGAQPAAGKDLWVGRITTDLHSAPLLRLFGGTGDEQFGGLASVPGKGLYVAGTTNSIDLPATANSFHGGATDGFIAALDPLTAAPSKATYIGGTGRDEIRAMETNGTKLLLGGDTDSPDLVLPGLNQGPLGGLDALFVLSDSSGVPARGIRLGGSADDRVLGVEPAGFGRVVLAGGSQSQDWIQSLDPFADGTGAQDGFAISVSYADLQVTAGFNQTSVAGDLYIGRDLQISLQVSAVSEPGMDGIIAVRSTDASRLLVSASNALPGTDQILIQGADAATYPPGFTLQALSDSGEVDVIVEGRSANSSSGIYPRQVLHVNLAPTALFVSPPKEFTVPIGTITAVSFFQAPILPDGTPGPPEEVRYGLTVSPALSSSDPAGFPTDSIFMSSQGSYRSSASAVSPGDYTLVPSSSLFSAAPGQSVTVHVVDKTGASVLLSKNFYVVKDTVAPLYLSLPYLNPIRGDSLVFTTDDPSRLLLGSDVSASAASVTLTLGNTVWLAAMSGEGTVVLHVSGTYNGQQVSEAAQVRLVPYKVAFSPPAGEIAVGVTITASATLTPQSTPDTANWTYLSGQPRAAAFAGSQLESSNPDVLKAQPQGLGVLTFSFIALQPGAATLTFPASAPAEFAGLNAMVKVVPATLNFGPSVIRIPAAGTVDLFPSSGYRTAPSSALKSVRLRLSAGAPVVIHALNGNGADVTVDFSGQNGATLEAQNAQAGEEATLFVSAPGIAEFSIPIHFVEPVFVPDLQEARLVAGSTQQYGSSVFYHMAASDRGQVVEFGLRAQQVQKVTLRPVTNPPGICTAPASIDVIGFGGLTVSLTCAAAGVTFLNLQPGPGVSSVQTQFSVRVVSQPPPFAPLALPGRLFVGNGLQSELSLYVASSTGSSGPFIGTLTSNDPDRVRLSMDRTAPGSASVTMSSGHPVNSVFVQGYASDGIVTLSAQSVDGNTGQVTVYLFPSTLALRPPDQFALTDLSAILSLRQPLSTPDFTLSVRPCLVDPGSKKLLCNPTLSIRAGTNPVFVRAQTSDATIVQVSPPDAIVSEGDASAVLKFHAIAAGDVILSATQPDGFIAVPESSLSTHVFERGLEFNAPVVLSADLETAVAVGSPDGSRVAGVTATSLDPQKLVLSTSQSAPGQASVTVPGYAYLFLQALSGVQPGESVSVRLEGPGYLTSQANVTFAAAELQTVDSVPLSLQPLANATLRLVYGPVDSRGLVSFNGTVRPGVSQSVQVSSSDTNILAIDRQTIPLDTQMSVPLRPLAPGRAQILIQAPPQLTNRVPAVDAVVGPYQFRAPELRQPTRYLVSQFTVTNPRPQATTINVTGSGAVPVRLGTAASGANGPAAPSLPVTLNANETRALYIEPAGPGNTFQLQLTASDFASQTFSYSVQDPLASLLESGPLSLKLAAGAVPLTVFLYGYPRSEFPLGTAYGPLNIQVQSSDAKVISVPAAPVTFNAGDSRKTILLQAVGTGDAVVSVVVPASFAGGSPTRQDIVVSVR